MLIRDPIFPLLFLFSVSQFTDFQHKSAQSKKHISEVLKAREIWKPQIAPLVLSLTSDMQMTPL